MNQDVIKSQLRRLLDFDKASDAEITDYAQVLSHHYALQPRPLPSGTSAAVTFPYPNSRRKVAALAFDRVWGTQWDDIPEEVRFSGLSVAEVNYAIAMMGFDWGLHVLWDDGIPFPDGDLGKHLQFKAGIISGEPRADLAKLFYRLVKAHYYSHERRYPTFSDRFPPSSFDRQNLMQPFCAYMPLALARTYSQSVIPIFDPTQYSAEILDRAPWLMKDIYRESHLPEKETDKRLAVLCTIENLGIVDEKSLNWEQVLEFRRDRDVRMQYLRLLHWIDENMANKSIGFIQDAIEVRLDDYNRALIKHGIETRRGVIKWLLSGKALAKALGVGGAAAATTGGSLASMGFGALIAGVVLGTEIFVKIEEHKLNRLELEDKYLQVEYIDEVKSRLGN